MAAERITHVSIYRPGNGNWLREEVAMAFPEAFPVAPFRQEDRPGSGRGWFSWQGGRPARGQGKKRPAGEDGAGGALIFEQQRLPGVTWISGGKPERLAEEAMGWLASRFPRQPAIGNCHVFTVDGQGKAALGGPAAVLRNKLARLWEPSLHGPPPAWNEWAGGASGGWRGMDSTGQSSAGQSSAGQSSVGQSSPGQNTAGQNMAGRNTVMQCFLVQGGLWCAVSQPDELASPFPCGVSPLRQPEGAPSRSALKLEESWLLSGWRPGVRETVIDLGAAPGGWSHACLRRGCRVMAVDNASLRLQHVEELPGELTHLRADGLRFRPPASWLPVDWLLADMLIPPGVCLGLLKKWIGNGWMRRFVVNLKLPQREPLAALAPVREYLAGVPGLRWRMRQLYHDRREVTVMGAITGGLKSPAGGDSAADKRRRTSKPKRRPPAGSTGKRSGDTGKRSGGTGKRSGDTGKRSGGTGKRSGEITRKPKA